MHTLLPWWPLSICLLFKFRGGEEKKANLTKVHSTLCLASLPWQASPAAAGWLFFFCNSAHDISWNQVFLKVSSSPFSPLTSFFGLFPPPAMDLCLVPSSLRTILPSHTHANTLYILNTYNEFLWLACKSYWESVVSVGYAEQLYFCWECKQRQYFPKLPGPSEKQSLHWVFHWYEVCSWLLLATILALVSFNVIRFWTSSM